MESLSRRARTEEEELFFREFFEEDVLHRGGYPRDNETMDRRYKRGDNLKETQIPCRNYRSAPRKRWIDSRCVGGQQPPGESSRTQRSGDSYHPPCQRGHYCRRFPG